MKEYKEYPAITEKLHAADWDALSDSEKLIWPPANFSMSSRHTIAIL